MGIPFLANGELSLLDELVKRSNSESNLWFGSFTGNIVNKIKKPYFDRQYLPEFYLRPTEELAESCIKTKNKKRKKLFWRSARERVVWLKEIYYAKINNNDISLMYASIFITDRFSFTFEFLFTKKNIIGSSSSIFLSDLPILFVKGCTFIARIY